jgi:flagellar basal-body rod protein FlgG
MLSSIYTPLSGAIAQEHALEIIANNLANANTIGFKAEQVSFKLLEPEPEQHYKDPLPPANFQLNFDDLMPLRGNEISYVGVSGVSRDLTQGSAINTGNPLDVMIKGEGFFQVNTKEGLRYSRNGSFSLNQDGALVDKNGSPIMGEKGDIYLHGKNLQINTAGEIYQDNEYVDRLALTTFEDKHQLEKVGGNYLFYHGPPQGAVGVKNQCLEQGYLEASNVNAVKNLTDMILAHRSYEAYQKAIKNYDSMMEKSSSSIGELR